MAAHLVWDQRVVSSNPTVPRSCIGSSVRIEHQPSKLGVIGSNPIRCVKMVVVAQLVEPRIVVPVVVGSSPIYHPFNSDF